jgi:hypothetical protein
MPQATWPILPLDEWRPTYETLQRWTQIVGKVRLSQSAWINHAWGATLYVTASGLTTGPIPHGDQTFQIDFDFIDHRLIVQSSAGVRSSLALEPQSVAEFYRCLMRQLNALYLPVHIHGQPNELADAIPFAGDDVHLAYDAECVARFFRILTQAHRVLSVFRARFIGKCSPVHFFWGAADLAVTRFSGRRAPEHPGGVPHLPDWVTREAYSHEVSSAGFWPGSGPITYPAFYSYAYPEPFGFSEAKIHPVEAFYSPDLREFILPYDAVRESAAPDDALLTFLQSSYEAAATLGRWDRAALEREHDPRPARELSTV